MKVIINIECDSTNEAQELFKTLAGMSTPSDKAVEWGKLATALKDDKAEQNAAWVKLANQSVEPSTGQPNQTGVTTITPADTTSITAEEVKTEVAKRQRASRAKEKPLATGSDPVPYELSAKGTAAILNTMTVLADEGQTESSTPKTIEDVRLLAKALMNKGHNARLQTEMTKLGATRLSEIKDYDEAFNVLTVLTKEVGL